jgi:hypothetical protein
VKWELRKIYSFNCPTEKLRINILLSSNKPRLNCLFFFGRKPKNNEKTIETEMQIRENPSDKQLFSGNNL